MRVFVIILSVIILIVFCVITFERTQIWKTRGTFWGDVAMKNPNLELPYLNRGIYYMTIEDKDAALADFSKALKIFPDYQDALKQRYHLLISKGLYNDALNDLTRLIRLDPSNVAAHYMMGEIYGKYLNDPDNALIYLNKAFKLNPEDFSVLSNLGIVYAMKGDVTNAIKYFNFAEELQPNDANLLLNLSILYGNIGDIQKAEEYRKKAELAK
ncbi:MAG: tetratricopeptide repeat protein [Bacteroidales bacterium]|nr:tetratricopeptide repeat protein [Bacteroidales bacterium]